jgi:hypothetical protein
MTPVLNNLAFGVLLMGFAGAVAQQWRTSRKWRKMEWLDLVAMLQPVDFAGISTVAVDYLTPCRGQLRLEPDRMWRLLGGYKGLKRMSQNAEVMLALASYAQRWNFEEAVIVTERMRLDAAALRRAVRRVRLGMLSNRLLQRFRFTIPLNAQEASSTYYLMRQRLFALYETSHESRLPALAACL